LRKLCIRTPWPRCLCLASPVKILLCNTAVECDPIFSFLQLIQLLQKRQSDSSDSIRSLNYDNISSIRIKEHPKETEDIEMTLYMQLKLCKDLPCGLGFTHCWRLYGNMFFVFNCSIYSVVMGCCLIDIYPISLFCVAWEAGWHLGVTSLSSVCLSVHLSVCHTFVISR
jgi:hypothetical protein